MVHFSIKDYASFYYTVKKKNDIAIFNVQLLHSKHFCQRDVHYSKTILCLQTNSILTYANVDVV